MLRPMPAATSMQPLGTCADCGHWGEGICKRYPPPQQPHTESAQTCGEWCPIVAFTIHNMDVLKELIPENITESAQWLLEPIPFDFIRFRMSWKQFWPYAWHLYVFLKELKAYGAATAAQRSTLYYVDGRAKVSRKPFVAYTNLERTIKDRCTWIIDYAAAIFPTLVDQDVLPTDPPPDSEKINPFLPLPLYERADLFNSREMGTLEQLKIEKWEQLDGLTLAWFKGLQNCGPKTARSIIKKWRAWKREQAAEKKP